MLRRMPWIALGLLLLASCGNRRLLIGVDALSFTEPSQRAASFGPVPALPVPVATGELAVIDDVTVNMFGGARDVMDIEAVTLTFAADIADSTGDGLDTLRIYLSDATTAPTATPPVLELPLALVPGQHTPVNAAIAADPRVTALFAQDRMRVSVTTSLRGPGAGQALNGRLDITRLRADVVARHHRV